MAVCPANTTADGEALAAELLRGDDPSDAAAPAGLTTVRQSLRDQGSRCARIALGHREPPAADEHPAR